MLSRQQSPLQLGFYSIFEEQLSRNHPLHILANQINWEIFENAFSKVYSEQGCPAKPIRNISDERLVEQWSEYCYYQYFGG